MKARLETISLQTRKPQQLVNVTEQVEAVVAKSGAASGLVTVTSMHTTAGITVNERVECVQADITAFLERLAPKDGKYRHARYLQEWGGSAANAESHLRLLLTGVSESFPVREGKLVRGSLQAIYFVELDGPALRHYTVQVIGE